MPEPQRPYTKPKPVFLNTYPHPTSAENADELIEEYTGKLAKLDAAIITSHNTGNDEQGNAMRVVRRQVAEQLRNIQAHKAIAFT